MSGAGRPDADPDAERQGPTVRDRRRIDPDTYQVREPQDAAPAPGGNHSEQDDEQGEDIRVTELETALAERTADLQRLQAEYVNYKRRVDRDRDVSRKTAVESVLKDLLPVLDDIRSAREHDELTGAFRAVGDSVNAVAAKNGLVSFGEKGDPFDPHVHEALLHSLSADVTGPTCVEILQPGYRVGERVLRPARVAVAEPDPDAPAAAETGHGPTETRPEPPSTGSGQPVEGQPVEPPSAEPGEV